MERNIALLTELRDFMVEHPDQVNMNQWAYQSKCKTVACAAGWASILSGAEIDWSTETNSVTRLGPAHHGFVSLPNGGIADMERYGADVLGLTYREKEVLFFSGPSEVLGYINRLIAGEDITGPDSEWDVDVLDQERRWKKDQIPDHLLARREPILT